jgi:hypothetical protein
VAKGYLSSRAASVLGREHRASPQGRIRALRREGKTARMRERGFNVSSETVRQVLARDAA